MNTVDLIFVVGSILAATSAFIWVAIELNQNRSKKGGRIDLQKAGDAEVERVFNDAFREELRNRGRLHFERIIRENAMFLQQDLRLTTAQLNDFMKEEIKGVLKDEFAKYEESITSARDQAIESIQKTLTVIEQQRAEMQQEMQAQYQAEKDRVLNKFEANMGEIVNHYIIEALSSEIDISGQLDFIFDRLEENKQAIIDDVRQGT